MTQQGTPNPIELYEGAVQYMLPILGGVNAGQLGNTTPCTEWSVQGLMNHQLQVAQYLHTVISESAPPDPSSMFDLSGPLPSEAIKPPYESAIKKVLDVAKAPALAAFNRIFLKIRGLHRRGPIGSPR